MMRSSLVWACCAWAGCLLMPIELKAQESTAKRYAYNREIRPILADKCFACHGFDAKQRQANLRLDQAEVLMLRRRAACALSCLVISSKANCGSAIESSDPDTQMPPKESHKSLTESEKAILKEWIQQGAEYQGHWAFEPITNPSTKDSIDDWIERPLKEAGGIAIASSRSTHITPDDFRSTSPACLRRLKRSMPL